MRHWTRKSEATNGSVGNGRCRSGPWRCMGGLGLSNDESGAHCRQLPSWQLANGALGNNLP